MCCWSHYPVTAPTSPTTTATGADNRDEILCPPIWTGMTPPRRRLAAERLRRASDGVSLTGITDCVTPAPSRGPKSRPDAPLIERYLPSPWDLAAAESGQSHRDNARHPASSAGRASVRLATSFRSTFPRCSSRAAGPTNSADAASVAFRRSADLQPCRGAHRVRHAAFPASCTIRPAQS